MTYVSLDHIGTCRVPAALRLHRDNFLIFRVMRVALATLGMVLASLSFRYSGFVTLAHFTAGFSGIFSSMFLSADRVSKEVREMVNEISQHRYFKRSDYRLDLETVLQNPAVISVPMISGGGVEHVSNDTWRGLRDTVIAIVSSPDREGVFRDQLIIRAGGAECFFKKVLRVLGRGGKTYKTPGESAFLHLGTVQPLARRVAYVVRYLSRTSDFDFKYRVANLLADGGMECGDRVHTKLEEAELEIMLHRIGAPEKNEGVWVGVLINRFKYNLLKESVYDVAKCHGVLEREVLEDFRFFLATMHRGLGLRINVDGIFHPLAARCRGLRWWVIKKFREGLLSDRLADAMLSDGRYREYLEHSLQQEIERLPEIKRLQSARAELNSEHTDYIERDADYVHKIMDIQAKHRRQYVFRFLEDHGYIVRSF
jgi:hypothetical protein